MNDEQWAMNNEQWAVSYVERTMNNEQWTMNNEQWTVSIYVFLMDSAIVEFKP